MKFPLNLVFSLFHVIFLAKFPIASSEDGNVFANVHANLFPNTYQNQDSDSDHFVIPGSADQGDINFVDEKLAIRVPYSSAPIYLLQLARTERLVYDALVNYERHLVTRLDILQRLRMDYEESVLQPLQRAGKADSDDLEKAFYVASDPHIVFRMIRRFARDFQTFGDHIWQSFENELWETLESFRGTLAWPTEDDFVQAAKSIMRLQETHDFDIHYFTSGAIRDHSPAGVGLTALQCLEISQTAIQLSEISPAMEWFQAAHSKVVHDEEKSVPMDQLTEAWERTYKAFQTEWPLQQFKTHDVFSEAKTLLRKEFNNLKKNKTFEHRIVNYRSLCRGDVLKTKAEIAKLKCVMDNRRHSYWYMNPLRIEVHNLKPLIYQVHDFIGPEAINMIGSSVVPTFISLAESGVALTQPDNVNSFTFAWVDDLSSVELFSLSRKIELLTGLNVLKYGASEAYHFSTFAVGNHYEPCTACAEVGSEILDTFGRKMTTVHVVLEEPMDGGELAFTLTGSLVKPEKGSLIVYNNLRPNGDVDVASLHGSCPILLGQKWVATKWIHEHVNFNKRLCPKGYRSRK